MTNLILAVSGIAGSEAIAQDGASVLGKGAVVAIIAIAMVFAILALIIAITTVIGNLTSKLGNDVDESSNDSSSSGQAKPISLDDPDATVAVLVASIDYQKETKKDVKVVSVKEIV